MKVKVEKIFNGFVSVRDHLVEKCVKLKEDLVIEHNGEFMTVPFKTIANPIMFQIHKTKFRSKYNTGMFYELYDFKWKPDEEEKQQKLF